MDESAAVYKEKYETTQKYLDTLKDLAHKAVADYEDLKKKYDQNHKQYDALREELEVTQAQLKQVNTLMQPAYEEFSQLSTKCVIEGKLKNEAERFAAKMVNQNTKLKRQSQMLLDIVQEKDLSISQLETITDEQSDSPRETQDDHFQKIIDGLRDELVETQTKLKLAEEQKSTSQKEEKIWRNKYDLEKKEADRLRSGFDQSQVSLKKHRRASSVFTQEYNDLKNRCELEQALKNEAIKFASVVVSQKNAIQRQSVAAITDAASDKRVHKAFEDIEELSKTLELERAENKQKIEELEEAIQVSADVQSIEKLEEQIQTLTSQLKDITLWRDKLEKENKELTDKLDVAEQRLRPPPPPPPPPPPMILRPLHKLLKKKKDCKGPGGSQKEEEKGNAVFNQALSEMMDRIKTGATLKSSKARRDPTDSTRDRLPSLPDSSSKTEGSMNELHNILGSLKRSRSVDHRFKNNNNDSNESTELLKKFESMTKKNLSLIEEKEEEKEDSLEKGLNKESQ